MLYNQRLKVKYSSFPEAPLDRSSGHQNEMSRIDEDAEGRVAHPTPWQTMMGFIAEEN